MPQSAALYIREIDEISAFISFILSSSAGAIEWQDEDCGPWSAYEGKVFSLEVGTSFHGGVTFKLCKSKEQPTLSVAKRRFKFDEEQQKSTETVERYHIKLPKAEYDKIYKAYKTGMRYNTLDKVDGLDGSTWCLESQQSFTYTKACFWTPSYKSESRGLKDLFNLGEFLWEFSGLDKNKELKLY